MAAFFDKPIACMDKILLFVGAMLSSLLFAVHNMLSSPWDLIYVAAGCLLLPAAMLQKGQFSPTPPHPQFDGPGHQTLCNRLSFCVLLGDSFSSGNLVPRPQEKNRDAPSAQARRHIQGTQNIGNILNPTYTMPHRCCRLIYDVGDFATPTSQQGTDVWGLCRAEVYRKWAHMTYGESDSTLVALQHLLF